MNDTNDDEANDPEFNFLDELENERKDLADQEEIRWHRAVKISSMLMCNKSYVITLYTFITKELLVIS